jgi:glycosyltransferase involved in cell wall biosynthesis
VKIGEYESHVGVVIPCLDEEAAIGALVREILGQGVDQVVVVDGGSRDRTAARAAEAGALVIVETRRGYGYACAAGVAALRPSSEIVVFMDGDGADVPTFIPAVAGPVMRGEADFVMGSRVLGVRESGSMTLQQIVAGRIAGLFLRAIYGVRCTDMSPFKAIRRDVLAALGMSETTYGWNLEMQMRAAAAGLRCIEVPVDHRARIGGVSKVSGNLKAGIAAAVVIIRTCIRLALALRSQRKLRSQA